MFWHIGWYGTAVGALLLAKLLASLRRRANHVPTLPLDAVVDERVHAIITVFNEDPEMLDAALASLLAQSSRPGSLTVIDDASADPAAADVAEAQTEAFAAAGVRLSVIRFDVNAGKRHGLAAGFLDAPRAEIYVCVDSDTILAPAAVELLVRQFDRRDVHAATGLVLAHNRARNLLTRLIDMRYQNAFLGERVAYSRLGSVLCVCGSLAAYRGWVARKHLPDFLSQRFLGAACTFGDDRRLTYYALTEGRSVIQPAAVAWTNVPHSLRGFLKQQCRWTKSFIREALLLLLKCRVTRAYWWLNLVEIATWIAFTSGLIYAMAAFAQDRHAAAALLAYGLYVSAAAWIRSLHYLRRAGSVPAWDRAGTFAAAPVYALMNVTLLIPLRLYAIATLRRNGWGTRGPGAGAGTGSSRPRRTRGYRGRRRLLPGNAFIDTATPDQI